ncbi:hypothetical protein J8L98_00570 [Pseudoalteromonas sp. MMG013]|uniref:hypothetical protein n=1 Tax=Pseudoalteromonas sp. MMG013 TaxID=2822687 RepID=UPI001B387F86|nr:hypothetical protein [Pseudoalteromonas sp. MMG013]MBQ4860181.1 hypothetical protein [Pseudoalteromonas sp. MMG013]
MNIEKKYQNATTLALMSTLLISAPVFFILSSLIWGTSEYYFSTILFWIFIDLYIKAIPAAIIYLVIKYTRSQAGYLFLTVFVSVTTLIIAFSYYVLIFGSTLFPTSALSGIILFTPYVMLASVPGLIIGLAAYSY